MYVYEGTNEQQQRIDANKDHCGRRVLHGPTYDLSTLKHDNRISNPLGAGLLTTSTISQTTDPTVPVYGLPVYIFAIDREFNFRVAPDGVRGQPGAVKHESLFDNEDVLAAGELHFHSGLLHDLNDHSGTYRCRGDLISNPGFAVAIVTAINKGAIPVSASLHFKLYKRSLRSRQR